jgi:hypothetical protein
VKHARLAFAVLAGLGACAKLDSHYTCQRSAQCVTGALQGVCEPGGNCSFPDSACASGRRYAVLSSPDLADRCVDAPGCQQVLARINSCGDAVAGASGPAWSSDVFFDGGDCIIFDAGVSLPAAGAVAPAEVYETYRYDRDSPFSYGFSGLKPGSACLLRLHFNDGWNTAPGDRQFDVLVEGQVRLQGLDVIATAGGPNRALVEELSCTASAGGTLTVTFVPALPDAGTLDPASFVSGLELLGCPSP